jgi:Zn-dependent protease with chaperone function
MPRMRKSMRKKFDPSILRYPNEERLLKYLLSIYGLKEAVNLFIKIFSTLFEGFLLGEAVKSTEKNYPHIYKIGKKVSSILNLQNPPNIFVTQDPLFIAYTIGTKEKHQIVLSSALVENFSEKEISFVIGHELGHIIYDHLVFHSLIAFWTIFTSQIPLFKYLLFPSLLPLLAWSRNAEISADRVGLFVCRDIKSSINAMMKLSGGKEILKHVSSEEYMKQFDLIKKSPGRFLEFFSTHPFLPKRGKALFIFYKSPFYKNVIRYKKITPSLKEGVEKEVGRIMKVL